MRPTAFVLLAGLAAFAGGCGKKPDAGGGTGGPSDQDRVQGVWKIEAVDFGDPKEGPPKEVIEKARVVIKGDRFYFVDDGFAREESFVLDPTKTPKHITMTKLDEDGKPRKRMVFKKGAPPAEGEVFVSESIYRFDGDKLVLAVTAGDRAARPTEFKPRVPPKFDPNAPDAPSSGVFVVTLVKAGEPEPELKKRPKPKPFEPPPSKGDDHDPRDKEELPPPTKVKK